MTEKEFWKFLKKAWEKGREAQVSMGPVEYDNPQLEAVGNYLKSHEVLPRDYQAIPGDLIAEMGALLFEQGVSRKAKEAIMMILAHHGSNEALRALTNYHGKPDKDLVIFAELALQECEMWNAARTGKK